MIYLTFDPYNDNDNYKTSTDCFICFETIYDNKETIRLNNHLGYFKMCKCDSWVHDYCLTRWYNINNSCPICRCKMNLRSSFIVCLSNLTTYYIKWLYIIYTNYCNIFIFIYAIIYIFYMNYHIIYNSPHI